MRVEIEKKEDLGAFPLPATSSGRDGVGSGRVGNRVLWTFGDTFVSVKTENDNTNIRSATAGWSTVDEPLRLDEALTDAGIPYQFIPFTEEELNANKADPFTGWALWPLVHFDTGEAEGLVMFDIIRRGGGTNFSTVGTGTARVTEGAAVARREADLFRPPERSYGAGGYAVDEGRAYLFACETIGFLQMGCRVARAELPRAGARDAYEFYDGAKWVSDESKAEIVVKGVGGSLTVSRNKHLGRYLAVTSGLFSDRVILMTAEKIEGPYTQAAEFEPDGVSYLAAGENNNYLAREQPVLSGADGREVVISYSRPTEPFRGDVRLLRLTLR